MDEAVSLMTPDALNTRVPIPNMTSKKDGMNGLSAIGMPRSVSGVAARWLGSIPHAIKLSPVAQESITDSHTNVPELLNVTMEEHANHRMGTTGHHHGPIPSPPSA